MTTNTSQVEWFEDFGIGYQVVSPILTLTTEDVLGYVRFSNDVRPLFAPGHAPVQVPSMYLFSLGVGLLLHAQNRYIPAKFVAFAGFDLIRFESPARVGDRIRSSAVVTHIEARRRNGVVEYEQSVERHDGQTLVRSTQRILVERRDMDG
jgi:acyl dehydratase